MTEILKLKLSILLEFYDYIFIENLSYKDASQKVFDKFNELILGKNLGTLMLYDVIYKQIIHMNIDISQDEKYYIFKDYIDNYINNCDISKEQLKTFNGKVYSSEEINIILD